MTGSGLVKRAVAGFVRARRRFGWLDHLARAVVRYDQADECRLAAASYRRPVGQRPDKLLDLPRSPRSPRRPCSTAVRSPARHGR